MKIALVQLEVGKNIDQNVQKSIDMLEKAAKLGADIICFPEVHIYPFFPQYHGNDMTHLALEISDPIITLFRESCEKLNVIAVPNFFLNEDKCNYDASLVINSKGEIIGVSKMVHIGQAHRFYEQDYYTPSNTGFIVYDTPVCKLGVVICFDRHFPESIRTCVLKGAELIVIPTVNTKDESSEMFEWELRVQAMQNSVFIAMCNRVGLEDEMNFSGESIIIDPNGNVISKADDSEQLILADLEISLVKEMRKKRQYLHLRRPELYFDSAKSLPNNINRRSDSIIT